jgi:hypothetical protein
MPPLVLILTQLNPIHILFLLDTIKYRIQVIMRHTHCIHNTFAVIMFPVDAKCSVHLDYITRTKHVIQFYDRMTVQRSRFLVNKTNRCTEFQFYWCYYSNNNNNNNNNTRAIIPINWNSVHLLVLFTRKTLYNLPHSPLSYVQLF